MPPVLFHTKSPINAAKADGVTPKTAAVADANNGDSGIPQPGGSDGNPHIPAADASTTGGSVRNHLSAPLRPTPTQTTTADEDNGCPPPPQPGAVPVPYPPAAKTAMPPPPGGASSSSAHHNAPPPPAPAITQAPQLPGGVDGGGGNRTGGATYATRIPPQMGISLSEPTAPHAYRGTSTATTSRWTAAATSSEGRQVGQPTADGSHHGVHHPGYPPPPDGGYANASSGSQGQSHDYNNRNDDDDGSGGGEGGVWNSALRWTQGAGEELAAVESEVWRRINSKE